MEPKIFVKKVVSLNPKKYKFFSMDLMLEKYSRYLFTIHDHYIGMLEKGPVDSRRKKIYKTNSAKTFKEWLSTEI